jgi:hypothetical protein
MKYWGINQGSILITINRKNSILITVPPNIDNPIITFKSLDNFRSTLEYILKIANDSMINRIKIVI